MPQRDWDDDDDRPRRRRRRDEYDDDNDYYDRRRRPSAQSGSVTGVAVYGIVLGSLDLLLGLCLLIGVVAAGSEVGVRGGFHIPGVGSGFAIMLIITLLTLAWGVLAIIGSIGVINRAQIGRIVIFVVAGLGGAVGLLSVVASIIVLATPAPFADFAGAKFVGFLVYFVIAGLLISYCVWALVALIQNGHEFR
jgi:hypothetical protein